MKVKLVNTWLWWLDFKRIIDWYPRCRAVLSVDECIKADQFHFQCDRDAYTLTRGVLRHLLGEQLSVDPSRVEFQYLSRGKPLLAVGFQELLHFNVSHTTGYGIIGLADYPIGVDVEVFKNRCALQSLAKRFFTQQEAAELVKLPIDEQAHVFYRIWVRKEALLKLNGCGLSAGLNTFQVMKCVENEIQWPAIVDNNQQVSVIDGFDMSAQVFYAVATAHASCDSELVASLQCWI